MTLFHQVKDAQCVVRINGVHYQKDVFQRDKELYVAWRGGFIRLMSRHRTNVPKLNWESIIGCKTVIGQYERLSLP